jgi:hypothetical protein
MSIQIAKPHHEVAYDDLTELLRKHAGHLSAIEMLAVASNMVGKLVALQDQRAITPEVAMQTVAKNLEAGNKQILDQMAAPGGGHDQ